MIRSSLLLALCVFAISEAARFKPPVLPTEGRDNYDSDDGLEARYKYSAGPLKTRGFSAGPVETEARKFDPTIPLPHHRPGRSVAMPEAETRKFDPTLPLPHHRPGRSVAMPEERRVPVLDEPILRANGGFPCVKGPKGTCLPLPGTGGGHKPPSARKVEERKFYGPRSLAVEERVEVNGGSPCVKGPQGTCLPLPGHGHGSLIEERRMGTSDGHFYGPLVEERKMGTRDGHFYGPRSLELDEESVPVTARANGGFPCVKGPKGTCLPLPGNGHGSLVETNGGSPCVKGKQGTCLPLPGHGHGSLVEPASLEVEQRELFGLRSLEVEEGNVPALDEPVDLDTGISSRGCLCVKHVNGQCIPPNPGHPPSRLEERRCA